MFVSPMLVPIIAILAFAAIKIARIMAAGPGAASGELQGRVDELERVVQGLQRELGETQERVDFTERLIAKGKEAAR